MSTAHISGDRPSCNDPTVVTNMVKFFSLAGEATDIAREAKTRGNRVAERIIGDAESFFQQQIMHVRNVLEAAGNLEEPLFVQCVHEHVCRLGTILAWYADAFRAAHIYYEAMWRRKSPECDGGAAAYAPILGKALRIAEVLREED